MNRERHSLGKQARSLLRPRSAAGGAIGTSASAGSSAAAMRLQASRGGTCIARVVKHAQHGTGARRVIAGERPALKRGPPAPAGRGGYEPAKGRRLGAAGELPAGRLQPGVTAAARAEPPGAVPALGKNKWGSRAHSLRGQRIRDRSGLQRERLSSPYAPSSSDARRSPGDDGGGRGGDGGGERGTSRHACSAARVRDQAAGAALGRQWSARQS